LFACAAPLTQNTDADFELLTTESIAAPTCKPARGITTILMDQELMPEHIERRAVIRDVRIVIDWITRVKQDRLILEMASYTYLKVKGGTSALPVKLHETVCEISPAGRILSIKFIDGDTNESQATADPAKMERAKNIAASFAGMFIPAFQTEILTAGQTVASSVERFDRLVNNDRLVQTNYIYRGLSRFNNLMVIVIDYDQVTDIGPFKIKQQGYHFYDADRRYLVSSRGSTQILQDGKPYYSVKMRADTVFSR
jgi:hypothetical protein